MHLILLIQSSLKLDCVLLMLFPIEEANVIDVEQDDYVIVLVQTVGARYGVKTGVFKGTSKFAEL